MQINEDKIKEIQKFFNHKIQTNEHLYAGEPLLVVDGKLGEKTKRMVKLFQYDNLLDINGNINQETLDALDRKMQKKPIIDMEILDDGRTRTVIHFARNDGRSEHTIPEKERVKNAQNAVDSTPNIHTIIAKAFEDGSPVKEQNRTAGFTINVPYGGR